ncbi:MAG: glycoside hydrolase family 16 protein [Clostridia bacterium]|nr:glycoside hydrolase family 16 protein [Clostridia bacterium]
MFDKLVAFILSIIAGIYGLFNVPYYAVGEKVDMDKFELVWSDEFDGEDIDWNTWKGHYAWETNTDRKGSVWNKKMASLRDGNLVISTKYYADGLDGGHPGFYNYAIDTSDSYRQTYGYFECRCILPKGHSLWGAFWLYCEGVCDTADKGKNGAELDVFESMYYDKKQPNVVSSNIHIDGYEDKHQAMGSKKFLLKGDPYSEYNTYGIEWNSDGYTFYINGKKSFSTDWGGVSEVPEFIILSVEISGENGIATKDALAGVDSSEFIVDYVRAYQYKSR